MLVTGTVHPPGGASAVLAATSPEITDMGWYFVGLIMWGTTLMLFVSLVVNNIQRQFPMYWWTSLPLRETRKNDVEVGPDGTGGFEIKNDDLEDNIEGGLAQVTISARGVTLPETLVLNNEESALLQRLQHRLAKGSPESSQHSISSGPTVNVPMEPMDSTHGCEDDDSRRARL